ncbi:hypothetical protein K488DRAFT_56466 [Vararia minispora EC-137]|uniref:Uncharacterized protein n=1 Tax=Vararia minispora EC-137 TaxID=1314806 RepID=A0ACB8QC77_9AGAM|nr:hypothetical protein K488DRAFT_56466 [Vararia minispora EC-137]
MASRLFCIPGLFFLFIAFVLSLLVAISLPSLPALDITRTSFTNGTVDVSGTDGNVGELRVPCNRSYCVYVGGERTCIVPGHGYSIDVVNQTKNEFVGSGWTRGLAVHPVATIVVFLAFLCGLSTHITLMLLASILSFLGALLTLIAFAIDIALYVFVRNSMNHFNVLVPHTHTGPGFWITLVVFILLLLSGCTVCLGRRRERMSNAAPIATSEKPGLLGRVFRRRKVVV